MNLFSNESVDLNSLPLAEDITLQSIEHSYWKVLKWGWMIVCGILLLAAVVSLLLASPNNILPWALIPIPLFLFFLLIYWLMWKSFTRKAYALREKDIIYRSGWLIQKISVCPFNRIQHCSVNSGPFERKLGLASLSIYTAGSQGADLKIPGLKQETASNLRDFIMKKTADDEQSGN